MFQNQTIKRYVCSAMAWHGGRCVDAFLAFNGPDGAQNAYSKGWLTKNPCCYPSGKGQQVMAELVFKSGLAPLHWRQRGLTPSGTRANVAGLIREASTSFDASTQSA